MASLRESFYDSVYSQDNQGTPTYGWIQRKGTKVCMDIHCVCGHLGHVDAEFFYFYECPECHAKYAVGEVVKLIPLNEDQARHVSAEFRIFATDSE